jgi:hypothetical protein
MAKDEYLEIQELDAASEADKILSALIYVTTAIALGAFLLFELKLAQYGAGLFGN